MRDDIIESGYLATMRHHMNLLRPIALSLLAAGALTAGACAKRDPIGADAISPTPIGEAIEGHAVPYQSPHGQGVRGYNEPFPESYTNQIGLRAVTWDRWLAISVRNLGDESLFLEPDAFRLIMPDRSLYAIGQERHRMGLFQPTEVPPGESTVLIARLPELDNLEALYVVLNYPPRAALLRARIETTPEPDSMDTSSTP